MRKPLIQLTVLFAAMAMIVLLAFSRPSSDPLDKNSHFSRDILQ